MVRETRLSRVSASGELGVRLGLWEPRRITNLMRFRIRLGIDIFRPKYLVSVSVFNRIGIGFDIGMTLVSESVSISV